MAKMMLGDWMKHPDDERRAWYGGLEVTGRFFDANGVYDGICRVRLVEEFEGEILTEYREVEGDWILVDVEEGPFPSSAWYDWFYEQQPQGDADGRAEMETLAAWPLDDAPPSCPSCGGVETMPAYFGSEFGWCQCRACENLFTQAVAS